MSFDCSSSSESIDLIAAVSAATLEDALRASRLDHATLPPHPRKRHPCRLAENQLRLLHLVQQQW